MLLNCDVWEDSWESLGLQGYLAHQSKRKSTLNIHWKDWCWSSSIFITWCKELIYKKRPWCWEKLKAGGEGDGRGWDVGMASPTQWTWIWVDSGSWWWIGRPGMLRFMGSQRVGHDWATELNWTEDMLSGLIVIPELKFCLGASLDRWSEGVPRGLKLIHELTVWIKYHCYPRAESLPIGLVAINELNL